MAQQIPSWDIDISVSNASDSSSCSLKLFKFFQALRMKVFRLNRPKMRKASFCIAVRYELILSLIKEFQVSKTKNYEYLILLLDRPFKEGSKNILMDQRFSTNQA